MHAETRSGNLDAFATGGSMSIATLWNPLREMAAMMREMMRIKSAEKLGVAVGDLILSEGVFSAGGKTMSYGESVDGETCLLYTSPSPRD